MCKIGKGLPSESVSARDTTLILTEQIDWVGSAGHYLELHVGGETHLYLGRQYRLRQGPLPGSATAGR